MLVFGLLAFMATLLTLFLPETKDKDLPDSMRDVSRIQMTDKTARTEVTTLLEQ